jgi:hypothetical protein
MLPTTLSTNFSDIELEVRWASEFLGDADHVREIRATPSRCAWLPFVLAHNISKLFWRYGIAPPPENAVWACSFALTVLWNAELDLHANRGTLPKAWNEALFSAKWIDLRRAYTTPFALIFAKWFAEYEISEQNDRYLAPLDAAMRLWVETIYGAGVDLAAYAKTEVWTVKRILMRVSAHYDFACRLYYGPQPDDCRLEIGRPGEACPAYFWRGIEAMPIDEDLAAKVLDLMHRVEHPEAVHCDVPGGWDSDWDDLNDSDWIIKGWVSNMEDSELAQMEADLERMDAKEFYEAWNLSSVIKYWSYDYADSESSMDE